ncbi:hypothetical protein LTV02_14605 [Nocardia yamanashiensis]|uniref:hypothetical protein n=1 Tax=Nocardia yamanashiensis TaxID=209247 RepID=UPI001E2E22F6|nr:hypothetical protein [Nocardia yamanashiensis]UGT44541.1 hypothetical protein LTV02_14605 [Nocardia yamanashiensis]
MSETEQTPDVTETVATAVVLDKAEAEPVVPQVEAGTVSAVPEVGAVTVPPVPEAGSATVPVASALPTRESLPTKGFRDRVYPVLVATAAAFAVLAIVLGIGWFRTAGDLDTTRTAQADRDRAAEVAKDYALRSLTYDYKNLPAFFDNVQRGTSDALTKRYTEVHDTLTKIMTEAQVVATGNVLGTSVEAKGNDQYAVTVFATQRTQNIQQAEAATKPNLLTVTVAKNGGEWLVVDYGPKDAGDTKGGAAK